MTNNKLPIIYGILEGWSSYGVQAHSIDGQTGQIIESHFCSSENFAKSDLGFTDPYMLKWDSFSDDVHSTVNFNKTRKEKYLKLYPDGYEMQWIGDWTSSENIVELIESKNTFKNS